MAHLWLAPHPRRWCVPRAGSLDPPHHVTAARHSHRSGAATGTRGARVRRSRCRAAPPPAAPSCSLGHGRAGSGRRRAAAGRRPESTHHMQHVLQNCLPHIHHELMMLLCRRLAADARAAGFRLKTLHTRHYQLTGRYLNRRTPWCCTSPWYVTHPDLRTYAHAIE